MRALSVDAEAIERCGEGGSEIAVGAAAGIAVAKLKADLARQFLGMLEQ